jgi:hypothetical protein
MRSRAGQLSGTGPDAARLFAFSLGLALSEAKSRFDTRRAAELREAFVDPIPAEIIRLPSAMSVPAIGAMGCQIALRRRRQPAGGMYSYEPGSRSFEPIDGSVAGRMIATDDRAPRRWLAAGFTGNWVMG